MNHLGNVFRNEPVKGASVSGKAQGTQFPKNCGFDCAQLLGYGIHADILPLLDWFSIIIALNQAGSKRIKSMLGRLCQRQRMDSGEKSRALRSISCRACHQEKDTLQQRQGVFFLVESGGIEPPSEGNLERTSPGAVCYLHSLIPAGANTLRESVAS